MGEAQSAWPLLHALRSAGHEIEAVSVPAAERNRFPVLLSTTTTTGKEMAYRLAGGLFERHIYYPWDIPCIVNRALDAIRPRGYAVMETEIWPNMLFSLARKGIPAFLVNGRFSERTARTMRKHPSFWRMVYDCFTLLLVRSETDKETLLPLGVPAERVRVTGDCKVDALLLRRRNARLGPLEALFGVRQGHSPHGDATTPSEREPLFLAGSTHEGEEEMVLHAFKSVRRSFPSARLVIAPRHPERAEGVRALASEVAPSALLSDVERRTASSRPDIVVVDRIGVLFDLYGVVDAAFIGGSLVDKGGQNILEPAAFGTPLSHGPYMRDFVEAAKDLGSLSIATPVGDASEIAAHWEASMKPERRAAVRESAERYFRSSGGAARLSADEINGVILR